jgi:hypothetical protein
MALQSTVKVAIADEPVALRLLSALVLGWDARTDRTPPRLSTGSFVSLTWLGTGLARRLAP